jgi:hypothetical protein
LAHGISTRIDDWIERSTCASVDVPGIHPGPSHVPSSDRHTLPSAYRLGLKRAWPPPVVMNCTFGFS